MGSYGLAVRWLEPYWSWSGSRGVLSLGCDAASLGVSPPCHSWSESMQGESCHLAGVGCVVVRVASCLYRGAF
jgi:hypothetical protein